MVVIETSDHNNVNFGLFCIPNDHLITQTLLQNSPFFWFTLYIQSFLHFLSWPIRQLLLYSQPIGRPGRFVHSLQLLADSVKLASTLLVKTSLNLIGHFKALGREWIFLKNSFLFDISGTQCTFLYVSEVNLACRETCFFLTQTIYSLPKTKMINILFPKRPVVCNVVNITWVKNLTW